MAVKMMLMVNAARIIPPPSRYVHGQLFKIVTVMFVLHAVIHPTNAIARRSDDDDSGEIVNKVVCQGQTLKIRCPNSSYALSIHSGSYGRTQPGNIVCPYKGSDSDFYYNCGENDITEKLIQICKRKKKCIFEVGKAVFGDPCQGHAYLTIIYSCVKRKRRKKHKTTKASPTTNLLHPTNTTNMSSTLNYTMNGTTTNTIPTAGKGGNSSINSTFINNNVGNVFSAKKNGNGPGVLMSIIIWFFYVTTNSRSFLTVFLITLGSATFFFLIIFGLIILHGRYKDKRRRKNKLDPDNFAAQQQNLNTLMSANCDAKEKNSYLDTFPAPPPALPPPPDDMMYPSPSPDMINSSRPPPPPAIRGRSLDDISKVGQDKKHVSVTRSISLRTTRPPEYQHKEVNFAKLPNIDSAGEIQAVIIQRNNGSTMYMNPMYENGHVKEVTC